MDVFRILDENQISVLDEIKHICKAKKIKVYIVGGAVRDSILNLKTRDIDLCIEENPLEVIKALKTLKKYVYYEKFQTSTLHFNNGIVIDLIRCRSEIYLNDGMLPVIKPSSIEDDLYRRDFTINALAYDLAKEKIIDLHNGIKHINEKTIKSVHKNSYNEDPTRIFRAIRYGIRYGFKIKEEDVIKKLISNNIFDSISYDRYVKELYLICCEKNWIEMLKTCHKYGIFNIDYEKLGSKNILCNCSKNPYMNFLNLIYCSKDKKLNTIILKNSFFSKELINPIREFVLKKNEVEVGLLHAKTNYDIYNILRGMSDYELILFSWNDDIKYKIYNYVNNILKCNLKISGSEIKKLIKIDGKVVGLIKQFILRKNVNMLMNFDLSDFAEKNMGEILYDAEYKHR
ncbi:MULTISPECIES: CCA tRNA nucleotidyltransferase [Clostridium]|uniref:CCA tRNA nucleotidyltransferase n=1 Tax=Clostridium TaxID=1485 RepID=UPI000825F6F0|nr:MULTISPECIES: CCA tRNA nucleotidyltransferase [Clostridium]PJI09998.1 CCA tRNA nucleotidyltransferase [Clostridium sp. CT7]